jgi:NhaP-type Na+/H+ or K+/H+ antiporter
MNDIVSIVLFFTVLRMTELSDPFNSGTPFLIIAQFFSLGAVSVAIGVFFGFGVCLMFKHLRFLTISAVTETFLMLMFGLMAYYISEITVVLGLDMSGIITLLTYSIIQSHYSWYNLSPQGKSTTSVTFAFLGHTAEAAVYSYVGISLFTSIGGWWSISWIVCQFFIIVVGRIIGVFLTFYLFLLCFKKRTISRNELVFICYGGMIRGAIAYALVLELPYGCADTSNCYSIETYSL